VNRARFGLLGEKLEHSFSPRIHALLGDYEYLLYEKESDEVGDFLLNGKYDGLNVTMPYKKTVIQFCNTLSEIAEKTGSVNTIVRMDNGKLFGDNTDYYGFSYMLEILAVNVSGKKVIILGNGGAAATVRAVLGGSGAGRIVMISRRGADNYNNISKHFDAQIIVNTTPIGMYPNNGKAPIDLVAFNNCEAVLDLVFNPVKTELILQAEEMKIENIGGLHMLVAQAVRASELFKGKQAKEERSTCPIMVSRLTEVIKQDVRNIALIGMPGCGKTSVGKELARLTGHEFFDTDELVVRKANKDIQQIFAEDGEEVFRTIETAVLEELSKNSGAIIATGGGAVKENRNRRLLMQNSIIIFLDRASSELPKEGRPLSMSQGIEAIYKQRLPAYLDWCDKKVEVCADIEQTAKAVLASVECEGGRL